MSQRSDRTNNRRSQHPPGHRGRIYIFLVVALTVFLGGIVLWRKPADECTARVTLVHREGDQATTSEKIAETIGSDLAIHDVAREFNLDDEQAIRHHLLVDAHPAPRPGETTIQIWFKDGSPERAKAMADGLAEYFVQSLCEIEQSAQSCSECEQEQAAVARARADVSAAKGALAAFQSQHAGKYSTQLDGSPLPSESKGPAPVVGADVIAETASETRDIQAVAGNATEEQTPAAQPLNPEWVELDDRLQVLSAARDELLTKRTAAHPEVRDLQWQIDELDKKLKLIRRTIGPAQQNSEGAVANTPAPETAPKELPPEEPAPPIPPAPPEVVQQFRQLVANVAVAQEILEEAKERNQEAQQRHRHRVFAQAEITEPARVVAQHGAGVSRSGMAIAGLVALAVGLLATWRSQRNGQPAEIVSTSQLEALGVPVVASIRTGDGPVLPPPQLLNPSWIRWTTFGCELALAAIALTMLLLALAEWHIAAGLLRDPLSTLSEAVGRLGG